MQADDVQPAHTNLPALRPVGSPHRTRRPGRPPEWFVRRARRALHDKKLIDRLARIAAGEVGEIHYDLDRQGNVIREYTEAKASDQIKAIVELAKIARVVDKPEKVGNTGLNILIVDRIHG